MTRNGTPTASYTYDLNGNRATKTTSDGTVAVTVDDQDRLTSYGGATYAYTAHGDLRWQVVGSDTTFYSYDALGNLTQVRLPNVTRIGYLIDAMNRRIGKTVNDTLVRAWLYQGQLTPVAELDGLGNVVSRFVYATGVNVPDYLVKPGAGGDSTYRLIRDHLGSVRLVVNVASGSIAQRLAYDEFGVETENTAPGWQPFGFAGGLTDVQTGLVRFGARDYDPATGRWTAKDPIGFAGGESSLYSYGGCDPINVTDPSGLNRLWDVAYGGRIVSAGIGFISVGVVAASPVIAVVGVFLGALTVPLGIIAIIEGISTRPDQSAPQGPFELYGMIVDELFRPCGRTVPYDTSGRERGRVADIFSRALNNVDRFGPWLAQQAFALKQVPAWSSIFLRRL